MSEGLYSFEETREKLGVSEDDLIDLAARNTLHAIGRESKFRKEEINNYLGRNAGASKISGASNTMTDETISDIILEDLDVGAAISEDTKGAPRTGDTARMKKNALDDSEKTSTQAEESTAKIAPVQAVAASVEPPAMELADEEIIIDDIDEFTIDEVEEKTGADTIAPVAAPAVVTAVGIREGNAVKEETNDGPELEDLDDEIIEEDPADIVMETTMITENEVDLSINDAYVDEKKKNQPPKKEPEIVVVPPPPPPAAEKPKAPSARTEVKPKPKPKPVEEEEEPIAAEPEEEYEEELVDEMETYQPMPMAMMGAATYVPGVEEEPPVWRGLLIALVILMLYPAFLFGFTLFFDVTDMHSVVPLGEQRFQETRRPGEKPLVSMGEAYVPAMFGWILSQPLYDNKALYEYLGTRMTDEGGRSGFSQFVKYDERVKQKKVKNLPKEVEISVAAESLAVIEEMPEAVEEPDEAIELNNDEDYTQYLF